MKKQTLIHFMALGSLAASAQNKWNSEPYLTKALSKSAIKDVFVRTSGGSIVVDGVAPGEARIEVYINSGDGRDNLSKAELEQRLKGNYTLEITDNNHELHATAKSKSNLNWSKSLSISFKVYVPKAVSTNLSTSGGSLKLSQLKGKINATTSGGSINADHIAGDLSTSTSGGSINLTQIDGGVDAATSGGGIYAQLNSVGKYVKLNTSAGDIDLSMPQQKGFNLNLKGNRVNTTLRGNFEGSKDKDRVEGKINGGGALVQAYASSGSVNVKFE